VLIFSRKPGEEVVIGGGITVTVLEVRGNRVRVGVDAPDDVRILRGELAFWLDVPAGGDEPAEPAVASGW
jgi:carbon storage regulator